MKRFQIFEVLRNKVRTRWLDSAIVLARLRDKTPKEMWDMKDLSIQNLTTPPKNKFGWWISKIPYLSPPKTTEQAEAVMNRTRTAEYDTVAIDKWKLYGFWQVYTETWKWDELERQLSDETAKDYPQYVKFLTDMKELNEDISKWKPGDQNEEIANDAIVIGKAVAEGVLHQAKNGREPLSDTQMKVFEKMPWLFEAVGGLPTMSMTDVCQILQIREPFPTLFSSPERLGDVLMKVSAQNMNLGPGITSRFNAAARTLSFHLWMEGVWGAQERATRELDPHLSAHELMLDEMIGANVARAWHNHPGKFEDLKLKWNKRMKQRNRLIELIRETPDVNYDEAMVKAVNTWREEVATNTIPKETPEHFIDFYGSKAHEEERKSQMSDMPGSNSDSTTTTTATTNTETMKNENEKENGKNDDGNNTNNNSQQSNNENGNGKKKPWWRV